MVVFLTVLLGVSAAGMLAILWLKRYELRTGRIFLAGLRPALGEFSARTLWWFGRTAPGAAAAVARDLWSRARAAIHASIARGIVAAERGLELALSALRRSTSAPRMDGEASPFLREVAEHK